MLSSLQILLPLSSIILLPLRPHHLRGWRVKQADTQTHVETAVQGKWEYFVLLCGCRPGGSPRSTGTNPPD